MARVVVAMSGGVDSSVAAALVQEAGHEAIGVTLKLLPGRPTGFGCCGSPEDIDDAKRVCETLGIAHYVLNFDEVFEKSVVDRFVDDYLGQRTPNPCVECNRSVKFGALLKLTEAWDASFVATGHYARIERVEGSVRLLRSVDEQKDQTYFLHSLTSRELDKILFPIGELTKPQVRERAARLDLKTAAKPESQEICFVPNKDYRSFIRSRAGKSEAFEPGDIRDGEGNLLGQHKGLADYTIGQRKGLGVSSSVPLYVTGMDGKTKTLVVGPAEETLKRRFRVSGVSWTSKAATRAGVRIRHRAPIVASRVDAQGDKAVVELDEPQGAVAPGQAAVFYDGAMVLGGGTIQEVLQ